jgi:hypothetical protein
MIRDVASVFGIAADFAVLTTVFAALLGIAARLYGRMGE